MKIHRLITRSALVLPAALLLSAAQSPSRASRLAGGTITASIADLRSIPRAAWASDDPADSLYRSAREALIANDWNRAADTFSTLIRRFPESTYAADALYYRAYALYRNGGEANFREALRSLDLEQDRYPKAGTIDDAKELAVRIRGALAKRGDAGSAEEVSKAASGKCSGGGSADDIRGEAMNALLQMDAQSAVPIIKQVLQKRDECSASLRKKAVFLLSQKQTPETVGILIDAVRNDPSAAVREDAVFWLSQVNSEQAVAALEEIALRGTDARLRNKAIFSLGQQNSPRGFAIMKRVAESADTPRNLREQAIFQIGQHRSVQNAEYLRDLFTKMGKSDEALRKNVLFSLSQMQGVGNDRWLLNVALDQSNSEDVRKHALWTAGQAGIAGSELVTLYDRMPDRPLKEQLIWVLSESRDAAASAKLVDIAQHDKDNEMRKKAIFWLGQKNDPRIKQILLDILTKG